MERGRGKSGARSRTTSSSDDGLNEPEEENPKSKSKWNLVRNKVKQAGKTNAAASAFHQNRHHSQGQFHADPDRRKKLKKHSPLKAAATTTQP